MIIVSKKLIGETFAVAERTGTAGNQARLCLGNPSLAQTFPALVTP
jgi:hypothetical protein